MISSKNIKPRTSKGGVFCLQNSKPKFFAPKIIYITDSENFNPLDAIKKLPKNSAVILRDYNLSFEKRFELGKKIKKICREKKILFLVAANYKLALKLGADGMHLPEKLIPNIYRIKQLNPQYIVCCAAHNYIAAVKAKKSGADAILVSPVFKTNSHPNQKPLGALKAQKLAKLGIKTYALGGISAQNCKTLKNGGFTGFAGISGVIKCVVSATVLPQKAPKLKR